LFFSFFFNLKKRSSFREDVRDDSEAQNLCHLTQKKSLLGV